MSLALAGGSALQERVEQVHWETGGIRSSGDLEAGTKAITATSKQATPDYVTSLTHPAFPDSRIRLLRSGLRLQVTIDSFGGSPAATQLSYAVEVNGVERKTGGWNVTGAQYAAVDLTEGQFNAQTANEIKVYLWVDQGQAVVSVCQLWLGMGTCTTGGPVPVLRFDFMGMVSLAARITRGTGTGSPVIYILRTASQDWYNFFASASGEYVCVASPGAMVWVPNMGLGARGTVATDINCVYQVTLNIRSLS